MSLAAIVYIFNTIIRKIFGFFYHWYTEGSRGYWQFVMEYLTEIDRFISLRIMLANWYKPLYGDYSRAGRLIGIPIRLFRITVGIAFYAIALAMFAAAYALYVALPLFLLSRLV
ncbi:MAG: hypothetical protein Q8Q39_01650 [bacterium]|nr:hypothetical protein [bacterium]